MIDWQWLSYETLSRDQLYAILKLRQDVFIIEQNCVYGDIDHLDQSSWHLCGWRREDGQLLAYLRVVQPGIKHIEPSIGRVITADAGRGQGLGRQLMQQALQQLDEIYPGADNRISAQHHLSEFYASFGYCPVSEPYDEDGILHIDMLRRGG